MDHCIPLRDMWTKEDTNTYHILYDNGDEEDLSEAEVDAIVDLYD